MTVTQARYPECPAWESDGCCLTGQAIPAPADNSLVSRMTRPMLVWTFVSGLLSLGSCYAGRDGVGSDLHHRLGGQCAGGGAPVVTRPLFARWAWAWLALGMALGFR